LILNKLKLFLKTMYRWNYKPTFIKLPEVACFVTIDIAWSSSTAVSLPSAGISTTIFKKMPNARIPLHRTWIK
jgi:hypothetical protein